jgi:hypothetical protein
MSGFVAFVLIAPMVVVSVLGMALLSWGIKQCLNLMLGSSSNNMKHHHRQRHPEDRHNHTITQSVKSNDRQSRMTEDTVEMDRNDDDYGDSLTLDESDYPIVTIQFLATHEQDLLQEFLTQLESRIHWPASKLEILLCMKSNDDKSTKKTKHRRHGRGQSYGLTDANYDLILDRMEEGFQIMVATSQEDLLGHPPRGSLLFTFDSVLTLLLLTFCISTWYPRRLGRPPQQEQLGTRIISKNHDCEPAKSGTRF